MKNKKTVLLDSRAVELCDDGDYCKPLHPSYEFTQDMYVRHVHEIKTYANVFWKTDEVEIESDQNTHITIGIPLYNPICFDYGLYYHCVLSRHLNTPKEVLSRNSKIYKQFTFELSLFSKNDLSIQYIPIDTVFFANNYSQSDEANLLAKMIMKYKNFYEFMEEKGRKYNLLDIMTNNNSQNYNIIIAIKDKNGQKINSEVKTCVNTMMHDFSKSPMWNWCKFSILDDKFVVLSLCDTYVA